MSQFPILESVTENRDNDDGSIRPLSYAESIGVTRIITETFKVGGNSYTSLADAVAQARRLQKPSAGL